MGDIVLTLAEVERRHIMDTLFRFKGNKMKTARALGLSLKTIYNKLHEHGAMEEAKLMRKRK